MLKAGIPSRTITIVVAVEEKYGVAFKTEELGQMTCVGDFITVLKRQALESEMLILSIPRSMIENRRK